MLRARLVQGMLTQPKLFWEGRTIAWHACQVCGAPTLQALACQPDGSWGAVGSPSEKACWDKGPPSGAWELKQIIYRPRFDVVK